MSSIFDDLKQTFQRKDNAVVKLIVLNVAVYVVINIFWVFSEFLTLGYWYNLLQLQFSVPAYVNHLIYRPWTLLTYAFMHAGLLHIFFNMLNLYWFGKLIAEYVGSRRVVSLYVLGALAGSLSYILIYNLVPYYQTRIFTSEMVGASGAVCAVIMAAATLLPDYTFYMLFIGAVRIKYIAAFVFFVSFVGLPSPNAGGNIAHLAGILVGYIFISQLRKGNDLGTWINKITDWLAAPTFRTRPKMKVSYSKTKIAVNSNPASNPNKAKNTTTTNGGMPTQAEIDAILDKISASGYESLTKEEKQKLFRASQK
ncbi:MAG: rhomboid family intramembrane serine protease [Microscillaceae bacterium]|nr:rhomboid family intramembrane serine protease [Microscillaceae bacterium]MDW8461484.1 rhomboid family intramembrane serine protease [Cytophagales bacterium]